MQPKNFFIFISAIFQMFLINSDFFTDREILNMENNRHMCGWLAFVFAVYCRRFLNNLNLIKHIIWMILFNFICLILQLKTKHSCDLNVKFNFGYNFFFKS
jgi:uncharacterized protein YebE (UPF0316 family)